MNYHPGTKALIHRACCTVAAAAILSALIGCESPLTSPGSGMDDRYSQSLLARAFAESSRERRYADTPERTGRDFVRVDSGGPVYVPVAAAVPATGPAATSPDGVIRSIADAAKIGLSAAQLQLDEPVKDLSLQEAILRTAKHSLAIKVESYNPGIKEAQIVEAMAQLDAVFFGTSQWNNTDDPSLTPGASGFNNGQTWLNQFGVRRLLPSGAQVQATISETYRLIDTSGLSSASVASLKNRQTSYSANIALQVVQPLLRGFGSDVTEANIYLAQRDYRISLSEFKQKTMKSVADVEEAYDNLILARTNVEVLERLVVASEQTYRIVLERRDLDATQASENQALQALWTRKGDLHVAQKTYRAASDRLKVLMNDPDFDINSNVLINPLDKPVAEPFHYNTDECIDIALRQRPELQQARLQVERADIVVKTAKNGLLPKFDLNLNFQTNGIDSNAAGAVGSTVDPMNNLDFGAGIKFEIPFGNREADSILRRRQDERRQAMDNFVQIAQQVVADVKSQIREVYSTYEELVYRDGARKAAALEFESIIQIENIRPRTPEFLQLKLDNQARLAQAEQQLTQSLVNYNLAIMRLEQAKGTLLEFDRISLDRPPAEPDDSLKVLRFLGNSYIKK